jgi:CubicO group peptidase (beta-lactamase class C family)
MKKICHIRWRGFDITINISQVFSLILLLLSTLVFAEDKKQKTPNSLQDLEKEIRRIMAEKKVPGVSIGIVSADQVLWYGSFGKADVSANKPVTPDTLFRIGSTSKAFVSLSILQLVEQGRLKLDDPVHKWAPEVEFTNPWESTDPVRIVNVLEHTSGFDDIALREYAQNDPNPISLRDGLAFNPKSRVARWRPGTRMSYCNSGPPIAAYIVEKITGQRFEDYVQQHLFAPLEMNTTSYFLTPQVEQKLTKLYRDDGITTYPYWHIILRPSGSINASAREMGNYIQMYLNRGSFHGKQIVQLSSMERMEKPASTYAARLGMTSGYGLSNYTTPHKLFVFHGHDGGVEGGLTEMTYLPDHGRGFIMMMNCSNGAAFDDINELLRNYLIRDLPKPALPVPSTVATDLISKYSGWYEPISPRIEMLRFLERILGMTHIKMTSKEFQLKSLGASKSYIPVGQRLFREKDYLLPTLALIPNAEEGVVIQTMWTTFRKIPAPLAILQILLSALIVLLMVSSVLFALIWIPRKLFGRMRGVTDLHIRFIPFLSVLCLIAFVLLITFEGDDIMLLGRITWLSVSLFLLTILFALFSFWGFVLALRAPKTLRRSVAIHSLLVAAANMIVALYLLYWGIIGLRTWA